MQTCLKYTRVFWVVAILLMAGGQVVDAYQDFTCAKQHASERQTSKNQSDCPANHTCCHGHSHATGMLSDAPDFAFAALPAENLFDYSDAVVEGPVREIDYPPQLS